MKRSRNTYKNNKDSDDESDNNTDKNCYDYTDPFIVDDRKRQKGTNYDKKLEDVKQNLIDRTITMEKILALDLPMEENVWFLEHINILKENKGGYTEENYKIKTMIYQKYTHMANIDIKKLKQIKDDSGISDDIITKILNSEHNDDIKTLLYKKYKRVTENSNSSEEIYKVKEWVDTVLSVPTKVKHNEKISIENKLQNIWKKMNDEIFGLINVKEKIMETMCAKLINNNNKGRIICLVGEPGVGKTAIAKCISEALNMPFDQISFGAITDSSLLIGNGNVYISSSCGLFTKVLIKSKSLDMVLLLDEIDKISNISISSVLLHALDRTQNNRFKDMFIPEIPIDLSNILFILTVNSLDKIDPILQDRLDIINIPGYNLNEKITIVENHVFPKIKKELELSNKDIILTKNIIEYIINKTPTQTGMRDIERAIYKLCQRIILLKHSINIDLSYNINIKFPLNVDKKIVDSLLQ
jgi:ATP-dependent Lon protease